MSSWATLTKKNCSNTSDDTKKEQPKFIAEQQNNDIELVQNKHINSFFEIYNNMLDKINNGYFTILSINNNSSRRNDFFNVICSNLNYDYHIKYDNFNSDSDIQENINSEDDNFVPTYSKFAYH